MVKMTTTDNLPLFRAIEFIRISYKCEPSLAIDEVSISIPKRKFSNLTLLYLDDFSIFGPENDHRN